MTLDGEIFPDEIKQVVSKVNVESVAYYAKGYGMQSNYKATDKKEHKYSRYTTYELFMVERVTKKIMSEHKN